MEDIQQSVTSFVTSWLQSGLGVGPKVHIIHYHLIPSLDELSEGDGLALWSEQASESAHSAFAGLVTRFTGLESLTCALIEYNHLRF